jgi:signal transduction histidine kinase/ActR/RegA family two-component response regulator
MPPSTDRPRTGREFLAGGGEIGANMRARDWSTSALGPVEGWPQSLRTAVSILLGSPEALQLFWGPKLVLLYNDATRPIMGQRHEVCFGEPALEIWPEVREYLGGLLYGVMATGVATSTKHGLMVTERNGFLEEQYFTWSYSPIRIEDGSIGGVFQVARETTDEVLGDRRQRVLHALSTLPQAATPEAACADAMGCLLAADIPFALTYLSSGVEDRARLVAVSGMDAGLAQSPTSIDLSASASLGSWPLVEARQRRGPLDVPDLVARFGPQVARGWTVAPHAARILPLPGAEPDTPHGFLVVGLGAGLEVDAPYLEFLSAVATQMGTNLTQLHAGAVARDNARMLAALRQSDDVHSADLKLLFDQAPIGMALMRGPEHTYEYANDAYLALAGGPDLVGRTAREAFPAGTTQEEAHERLATVYRTGQSLTTKEVPTPSQRHEKGFVTSMLAPFRSKDGTNQGVLSVVVDVTQTVQARHRLEGLAAELSVADRRKDEFLAMLGHELRNPLAPIATAVELMKLREGTRSEVELAVIERQVGHLSRLVGDLLDVARIAQGKIELNRHVLEVAQIVDTAVEMASPLFEARRHQVKVTVPRTGLAVDADAGRLAQVLANLLTNAAKFTPPGGHLAVTATLDGAEAVLVVEDDGMGIAAELLPRVFDLFVQNARPLNRAEGGLGLGLALARNLVALHGGTIAAHSDGAGRGSRFTVRLPCTTRPASLRTPIAMRAPSATKRVLVVDDNEDSANLLADLLREEGHEVAVAYDGAQALTLLAGFAIEVGVLDIGLPVMNGYDLARAIRELPRARGSRLIAVSGYGQTRDRERGREAGFDAFFTKPLAIEKLLAEIARREPANEA